jgi:hypothetical protein
MGRAVWGLLVVALAVAVAVACACGALAPAANASLSVPTGGPPVTFTGTGTAGTTAAIAHFESVAGAGDNGTVVGEQNVGFRHVTWDQIALDGSDPGSSTIESGHVIVPARNRLQPWGLELGPAIAVANDGFRSVGSSVTFTPFSQPSLWGPFNTDTAKFDVVAPAGQGSTPTPAQTRGLGIVFLNAGASTQIQYYNGSILLDSVSAPASPTTSFAGLLFPNPVVTRVVVTLGGGEIFGWDGSTVTAGQPNPVAGDDIVLAEPAPARPAVKATAGVPTSPVLDTFTNTESSATAMIDWGDGTRTAGTIVPAAGGAFNVTGSHAYALTGSYTATVTVTGFSGDEQTSQTVIRVAPRLSTTSVTCSPSPVAVTASTSCTVTVSDLGAGGSITPTGTVAVSSTTVGASFSVDSGCVLGATGTPGVAICEVAFTPSQRPPAHARIDASYGGDGAHVGSGATAIVGVRPQRCTLKALSAKLKGHPAALGVLVTCDARANVTLTGKAVAARNGRFKAFTLEFGSLRATVSAGRPTVLVIKPSPGVVTALRAATHRHQHVSLRLTLTASSHATRSTTTTRVGALRIP